MSQFRDNSWLSNTRSKSVLKSLRCRSSGRSKSKSKSTLDLNKIYADNVSIASSSGNNQNIVGDNQDNNEGQVQVS